MDTDGGGAGMRGTVSKCHATPSSGPGAIYENNFAI